MGAEAGRLENSNQTVIFIRADSIGKGDEELGANLMVNFIYHLGKADSIPDAIVLMNAGVKLVVEGSEVLDELKELEEKGVTILACGTCLRYFNLEEKRKVGVVSNMPEIVKTLTNAATTITV